jgi:hypothetical protein
LAANCCARSGRESLLATSFWLLAKAEVKLERAGSQELEAKS